MTTLEITPRQLHRDLSAYLERARAGTCVVVASGRAPAVTIQAGRPPAAAKPYDWKRHFAALKKRPPVSNAVDDLRRAEGR